MLTHQVIVFDNGSESTRAGFAHQVQQDPLLVIPSNLGNPNLNLAPFHNGFVSNWDLLYKLWSDTFDQLQLKSEEVQLFFTCPNLEPKAHLERRIRVLMEEYQCRSVYCGNESILPLLGCGWKTGVSVHAGNGNTCVVPVEDGYGLGMNAHRLSNDLTGAGFTKFLMDQVKRKHGLELKVSDATRIKEKKCRVSLDYESKKSCEESFTLIDGTVVNLGRELIDTPEQIFTNRNNWSIQQNIQKSIQYCDFGTRQTYYEHIYLFGGSSFFDGFEQRLYRELAQLAPSYKIQILHNKDKHIVWKGARILAQFIADKPNNWVTQEEYDENGPTLVHRKCF